MQSLNQHPFNDSFRRLSLDSDRKSRFTYIRTMLAPMDRATLGQNQVERLRRQKGAAETATARMAAENQKYWLAYPQPPKTMRPPTQAAKLRAPRANFFHQTILTARTRVSGLREQVI